MRALTGTLEAAQRAVSGQMPRCRLLVRDKQARFVWLGTAGVSNAQSALCLAADGTTIIAVALDTGGKVWVRRVTDPALVDPMNPTLYWGTFSAGFAEICTDALAWGHGDVAVSLNGSTLRVFYVKSDGAEILCRESADHGVTWGDAATVKALAAGGASYYFYLASAGQDDCFWAFSRAGYRYVNYRKKAGGAWGCEVSLSDLAETGGEFNNCFGIAVSWWAAQTSFAVVASFSGNNNVDGRLLRALFDPTAEAGHRLTGVQRIDPPGFATLGFTPRWPALVLTSAALGSEWLVTYIDKFASGGTSWTVPMCVRSRDFDHWSYKIPLAFTLTYLTRLALICRSDVVYCHQLSEAYKVRIWTSGDATMNMTESSDRLLRYRMRERADGGDLVVELDNRDGRYDGAGQSGQTAEALRPLAQILVEQGLHTADGDERVVCRPFQVWGRARVRSEGQNWLRLYAYDGWELLKRWRPDATYVFTGKTLKWCIQEIAARAGYYEVVFDSSSEWDAVISYLAVSRTHTDWTGRGHIRALDRWVPLHGPSVVFDEGMTGYTAIQRLLNLAGGLARWGHEGSTDVLYCFVPHQQGESPVADHTYADGEVLSGLYVERFAWPTRVRATGDGVVAQGYDVTNAIESGMEFFSLLYSSQWATAAACQVAVNGALDDADARRYGGWLSVRPNVGLELFDIVTWSDSQAGAAGFTAVKRRVNAIEMVYEPLEGRWVQQLFLEGV